MPLYPGASRGCQECRRRRKKCDLGQPTCHRCAKTGVECTGLKDAQIFIHRTARDLGQRSHKSALVSAFRSRTATPKNHVHHPKVKSQHTVLTPKELPFTTSLIHDVISIHPSGNATYIALVSDFQPLQPKGIFSGDRISRHNPIYSGIALCIRSLLPLAELNIRSLDLAIFSLLATYMGGLKQDDSLVQLSQRSYTLALRESQAHIQKILLQDGLTKLQEPVRRIFLLLAITFHAFEFLNYSENPSATNSAHMEAALHLLQLCGPDQLLSEHLRQAVSGFRGILTQEAIRKRQPIFLAEHKRLFSQIDKYEKSRRDLLLDLALQIPRLLQCTDLLAAELQGAQPDLLTSKDVSEQITSLTADYDMLLESFQSWIDEWRTSENAPLYWAADLDDGTPQEIEIDPECIPPIAPMGYQLRFSSGQKAGQLVGYWGFLLETLMGLQRLQQLANRQEVSNDIASKAHNTALLILQAAPYLTSCWEGVVVTRAPLRTASRCLEALAIQEQHSHSTAQPQPHIHIAIVS